MSSLSARLSAASGAPASDSTDSVAAAAAATTTTSNPSAIIHSTNMATAVKNDTSRAADATITSDTTTTTTSATEATDTTASASTPPRALGSDGLVLLGMEEIVESLQDVYLTEIILPPAPLPNETREPGAGVRKVKVRFGDLFPAHRELDAQGPGQQDGDVSGSRSVVITFLRRFGCGVCRLTSLEISSLKEVLDKANIDIIAIGIEELGFEEFAYKQFFRGRILIDTDSTAFKILQLKRLGLTNGYGLFHKRGYQAALALAAGASSTLNFNGNYLQLGGVFIMDPTGKDFILAHKEEYAGDRPSRRLILETLGFSEDVLQYYKTSADQF